MVRQTATDAATPGGSPRELIDQIRPGADETRWREIPWQTDIRDACRLAVETGKPVFLWAMNGNPLGCT